MLKTLTIFKSFIIFVLLLSANVFFLGCDKNKGSTSQETPIDPELLILEEPEDVSASWLVQSDLDAIDGSKNIDKDDLKFKVPKNFTRFFFNSLREDFTEHPGSIIRGSCDFEKEVQESLEVYASETGSIIIS